MSIWLALIVPLIAAFVMLKWFKDKMTWWEVILPLALSACLIGISKYTAEKILVSDTEYHGALIVSARYYEPWSTWVTQTCTYTTTCCCDSKGNNCTTTTHSYDCSYCDNHSPYWEVTNSLGEKWKVSKKYYTYLLNKWHATPEFVELGRSIDYSGGCGKDGDAYEIKWDGLPLSSESTTTEHLYENRIKAAHTSFDFVTVTKEDDAQYSLVDYPEVNSFMQKNVIGADSIPWLSKNEKNLFYQWGMFLNGYLGPKKHARIYYILFKDQPRLAGKMQEAKWVGGNDNELVVCIGLSSKNRELQWVYPFSWTPRRKILVDMREELMNNKTFDINFIANTTQILVEKEWKRKDFSEFSYVSVEPPLWAKWVIWFLTIAATVGACYWAITNEYITDPNNATKTITTYGKQNWRKF